MTRRQCLNLLSTALAAAAPNQLESRWSEIAASADGTVGAAALHLKSGQLVTLHGDDRFPLASSANCQLP